MRKALAAGLATGLLLVTAACMRNRQDPVPTPANSAPVATTTEHKLTVAGRQRHYRAHQPSTTPGLPLVIVLHGGGGTGELFQRVTHMDSVADRSGFVVVYPDGSGLLRDRLLTWNAGDCCGYAMEQGVDDVAFVRALIDDVTARLRTDPTRVFVTGFSNGAMMAYRVGCELADRIAAIAAVSGAMNLDICLPSRPLPVLVMHGTHDGVVPYAGGPSRDGTPGSGTWINRSVQHAVDFWTAHDNCATAPDESRDGEVVRVVYGPCAEGTTVAVYTIEGGRHGWPGGEKAREDAAEPAPPRPDASTVVWEFFSSA